MNRIRNSVISGPFENTHLTNIKEYCHWERRNTIKNLFFYILIFRVQNKAEKPLFDPPVNYDWSARIPLVSLDAPVPTAP